MSDGPVFIDIGYIIGGGEGHTLVAMLRGMFIAWADQRGLAHETVASTPAPDGGLISARLSIHTAKGPRLAALHQGAHTLIRIPPGHERRQMACAGVRLSAIEGLPLPDSMAGWGDERRRYFFDPDRAIHDAVLGRIELDPAVIFGGDFSGLETN
jgi:PCRF domain